MGAWTGSIWLRIRTGGGNEPSVFIKCGELLELLRSCLLLRKVSVPWSQLDIPTYTTEKLFAKPPL
jgi:hypothetical protein